MPDMRNRDSKEPASDDPPLYRTPLVRLGLRMLPLQLRGVSIATPKFPSPLVAHRAHYARGCLNLATAVLFPEPARKARIPESQGLFGWCVITRVQNVCVHAAAARQPGACLLTGAGDPADLAQRHRRALPDRTALLLTRGQTRQAR